MLLQTILEGLGLGALLVLVCAIGIHKGPVGMVHLYDEKVQERCVALGLTTKEKIKQNSLRFKLICVPGYLAYVLLCVHAINGAQTFWGGFWQCFVILFGNVKKCAVGKHPKSEKHGNTAQFSEVARSGTQENCGGIGSGCRLRLRPLPVLCRRQSQRVARIDPNAVVVDKNIAENDRFDLFSR